jgi:Ca2+-binding RTX toxin-like protein
VFSSFVVLLLAAASAAAGPTKLNQGAVVSLIAAEGGTVNHVVVTYGPLKQSPSGGPPIFGNYVSDTAGIVNLTNPENACLTEDRTHDFCPDGTSVGEPGLGDEFSVDLNGGNDSFTATTSIGHFEVHGGDGADVLRGSGVAVHSPGYGTPPETFYSADELDGDSGNDHIYGDRGADFLDGGPGNDILDGGPKAPDDGDPHGPDDSFEGGIGNDLILAADHDKDNRIDCGPGKHDVAVIDKIDPKPMHCETVRVR